jgi:hypothetical protein
MLLILATVMLDFTEGVFKLAGFKRIELGFGFADIADQDLEVGRLGVALDKGGKSEFLDWHRLTSCGQHSKTPIFRRKFLKAEAKKAGGKRIVKSLIDREWLATVRSRLQFPGPWHSSSLTAQM